MKTLQQKIIIPIGFGILGIIPSGAIEPPKDDAPPPPSIKSHPSTSKDGAELKVTRPLSPEIKEASAYIGVISDNIPDILSAHIGLKAGEGVMIRDLAPDGPAEKSGLAKYDVITHVGGKTVGSPEELSNQIATGKPGDEISIDFIHKGAKATKSIKLEARPVGSGNELGSRKLDQLELDSIPDEQVDRIRDMIDRQLKGMMRDPEQLRGFRERRGNTFRQENDQERGPRRNGIQDFQFRSDATFRFMDNDGSIEMKSSDGKKDIVVRDHEGKEVWSGRWDNEEDKAAAPKEVRDRINKFNFDDNVRGGGFRFRMGGGDRDDPRDIR
jgi:hypothetical protein